MFYFMIKIIEDEEVCQKTGSQCSKADITTDFSFHSVFITQ